MTKHAFKRLHIPSGSITDGEFNAFHHFMLGDDVGCFPPRAVEKAKVKLIEQWNRQQPDTWQYWLVENAE